MTEGNVYRISDATVFFVPVMEILRVTGHSHRGTPCQAIAQLRIYETAGKEHTYMRRCITQDKVFSAGSERSGNTRLEWLLHGDTREHGERKGPFRKGHTSNTVSFSTLAALI